MIDLDEARHRMRSTGDRIAGRYADRRTRVPPAAVALTAYAAFTTVLLALGLGLAEVPSVRRTIASFDRRTVNWFVDARSDVLDPVFRVGSSLVDTWTVVGVLVGALSILAVERRWWQLTVVAVAPAVELATFLSVTFLVARPRPDVALGLVPITGSFPSGHAAMSLALYGGLAIAVGSLATRRVVVRAAWTVAALIGILAAISRVYLGLHYLSDVVVGVALGLASLVAAVVAADAVQAHLAQQAEAPTPRRAPSRVERVRTAAIAVTVAVVAWGLIVEPRVILTVQREQAAVPDLPASWRSAEIGVIADLQIGMWLDNTGMARRAVDTLVDARPAAVLLLGDFVYGERDTEQNVETAVEAVRSLPAAGIRTLAVFGNHDHESGAAPLLERRLESIGVEVLENRSVQLEGADGEPLHVVAVGASRPGIADPAAALDSVPSGAPRIVMMHNPATFDRLPAGSAPLAVAGHTHGGQIRVPFTPSWSMLRFVEGHDVHADGWVEDYGSPGNRLFVNRGIGMSLVPVRLNCTPAVTLFELTDG